MTIPFHIALMSKFIPALKNEDGTNKAKGEIITMDLESNDKPFNFQVVGCSEGYHWIWRHVAFNYWKVVGKYKESPWSCQ